MVDEILNRVELRNYFIDLNNLDHNIDSTDPKILSLESYFKSKKPPKPTSDKIVILNAYGEIIDGSFQENPLVKNVIDFITKDKKRSICTPFS